MDYATKMDRHLQENKRFDGRSMFDYKKGTSQETKNAAIGLVICGYDVLCMERKKPQKIPKNEAECQQHYQRNYPTGSSRRDKKL